MPGSVPGGDPSGNHTPVIDLGSINPSDCPDPFVKVSDLESNIRFATATCVKKIVQDNSVNLNQPLTDAFGNPGQLPLVLALSDDAMFFAKDNPALIPALLISLGANPNAKADGHTMLGLAMGLDFNKYGAAAQYMIELASVDVNQADVNGTPLEYAISLGEPPVISHLINRRANVNLATGENSPLELALDKGLEDSAIQLVNAGADVGFANGSKQTPLHRALYDGLSKAAALLIAKGAPVDAQDTDGETALIIAGQKGNTKIASSLIAASANLEVKNKSGETALFAAAEGGNGDTVDVLVKAQASLTVTDTQGRGLVQVTSQPAIALRLLAAGAPADQVSQSGETALSVHVAADHLDVVKELVTRGANLRWQDARGRSLLHVASASDAQSSAPFLIQKGIAVDSIDSQSNTPAFELRSTGMLAILTGAGADLNHLNTEAASPLLSHMNNRENIQLITAFLDRGARIDWGAEHATSYLIELLRSATVASTDEAKNLVAIAHLLLTRGVNTTTRSGGAAAIHYLVLNPFILNTDVLVDLVRTFRNDGANVALPESSGNTLKSLLQTELDEETRKYQDMENAPGTTDERRAQLKAEFEAIQKRLQAALALL
jgi:ankyrin repeat protein